MLKVRERKQRDVRSTGSIKGTRLDAMTFGLSKTLLAAEKMSGNLEVAA